MPKKITRTIEDIQEYQKQYYLKNNFKVHCVVCDKYINNTRFINHRYTNKHLRLVKDWGNMKKRKVRCDKGIPKIPKIINTETFKPYEKLFLVF